MPYLFDLCTTDSTQCFMNEYKDYTYAQLDAIHAEQSSITYLDFETQWSNQVAQEFGLDVSVLLEAYSSDPLGTNWEVREMWKYAAAKGVSGTPTVFVNGAKLDAVPQSVDDWLDMLNAVYNSQYRPTSYIQ